MSEEYRIRMLEDRITELEKQVEKHKQFILDYEAKWCVARSNMMKVLEEGDKRLKEIEEIFDNENINNRK